MKEKIKRAYEYIKEKEEKNKAYRKEIKEEVKRVKQKHGKYISPFKKNMLSLLYFSFVILNVIVFATIYSGYKVLTQNDYIVNIEQTEHRMLSEFDKTSSCDQIDNNLQKRECFIQLMSEDGLELYITNIAAAFYANDYAKENNDIVLAKTILDKLKELQISRHYDDLNADISTEIAFDIIGKSLLGKTMDLLMKDDIKINNLNILKDKVKMASDLEKEIRQDYNLEDYKAVIR